MNRKIKHHKSILPGQPTGVQVVDKDLSFALKLLKKQMKDSRILELVKDNRTYTKPSVTRRQQKIKAEYKQRMQSLNERYN